MTTAVLPAKETLLNPDPPLLKQRRNTNKAPTILPLLLLFFFFFFSSSSPLLLLFLSAAQFGKCMWLFFCVSLCRELFGDVVGELSVAWWRFCVQASKRWRRGTRFASVALLIVVVLPERVCLEKQRLSSRQAHQKTTTKKETPNHTHTPTHTHPPLHTTTLPPRSEAHARHTKITKWFAASGLG